jgi:hypothetical protein
MEREADETSQPKARLRYLSTGTNQIKSGVLAQQDMRSTEDAYTLTSWKAGITSQLPRGDTNLSEFGPRRWKNRLGKLVLSSIF